MCALASRMSDMMMHGGSIVYGDFTVFIEGLPAARVGDPFLCPMMTPMVPPIPHVGGMITWPGALTVLLTGQPAARMSDIGMCTFVIPNLVLGTCMTVDIGPAAFTPPFPPFITIPDGTFSGPASWGVANYLGLVNYLIGVNILAVVNIGGLAIVVAIAAALAAAAAVLVAVAQVVVVPPG